MIDRYAHSLVVGIGIALLTLGTSWRSSAQIEISYPSQAENVVTCNQDGQLRVRIDFPSGLPEPTAVTINFPPGIQYVPNSLDQISGNASIAEADVADPGQPHFALSGGEAGNPAFVDFALRRSGACGARAFAAGGGLLKDTVIVATPSATVMENNPNLNTYNLLSASLSHQYPNGAVSQDTIISDVPLAINRQVRLIQGGLGFVDSVIYYVVLGGVEDYELHYGGGPMQPIAVQGDTLLYELSASGFPGIFGADGRFSNGEQVDFTERFKVLNCQQAQNTVKHHAYWGCSGDICQRTLPATGSVAVIVPQPSLASGKLFERSLPACVDGATPDQFGFYYENVGATTAQLNLQLGFEGNTSLPILGDYGASSAALDTSSIEIRLNGVDISRAPDEVHNEVNACSQAPAVGAVSAARYFGFTLQPGDRLEIRGGYVYCCRSTCNSSYSWSTPIARAEVRDACGNTPRLVLASHDFADARIGTTPAIISSPATLFSGDTVTACFQYPSLDGYPNVSGQNTYALEVRLPQGSALVATGQGEVRGGNGEPLPFTFTGIEDGQLTLAIQQSDYAGGAVEFCLDLAWNCGSSGFVKLPVVLYQTIGPDCEAPCYPGISCSELPLLLFCPGGDCDGGGGTVARSETRRINLGLADPGNDRIWQSDAPANTAAARLDRAAPCDTVRTRAQLGVLPGINGPWAQGKFRQRVQYPFFKPIGARASIFRNGALAGTIDDLPLIAAVGDTLFEYDLTPATLHLIDPGFPAGFTYAPGDSVYIETDYYFDPVRAQGGFYDFSISSFNPATEFCVENQDISNAFRLSNDGFVSSDACGATIDRVQLVSAAVSFASGGPGSFTGCEQLTWEIFSRTQRGCVTDDALDFFPNEFRPIFTFDTLALAKLPGYTFSRLQYRRSPGVFTLDIEPFAEDADSLYFDIRSLYSDRGGPIPLWEEQARDEILKSFWQPSCASAEGGVTGQGRIQYQDPSCGQSYSQSRSRLLNYTPTGQFSFVLNPLVNNAFKEENCYQLSVANTGVGSGFDVPFTWLQVISPDGATNIASVRADGPGAISPNASGIYELGSHVNNATESIEICVSQTNCLPDSFLLVHGWNCEGYPSAENPAETCFLDTLVAYINPQQAEVQVQIVDQPTPSQALSLCVTDTIEVLVNSAQQADLLQPALEVILPPGVEVNTMRAGYPNDASITFEALPAAMVEDTVTFDLTQHTRLMGDSLPGTFSNPGLANRQMRLIFEIETGCGFDPSQSIALYRATGLSPCGDPAIGSATTVASNPIFVAGTEAPYELIPEVSIANSLQGCGSTAQVTVQFILAGGSSGSQDTSEFIVPPGIAYLPGSLSCSTAYCPQYLDTQTAANGDQVIRFKIPPGLPPGLPVQFSFGITDEGAACSAAQTAIYRSMVSRPPLVCGGEPCSSQLILEAGRAETTFGVVKPSLSITAAEACAGGGEAFQLSGALALSGLPIQASETIQVAVYCTDAAGHPIGSPVAGTTYSGPLSPMDSLPFGLIGTVCDGTTGLWVEAAASCGCDTAALYVPLPNPTSVTCPLPFSVCEDEAPVPLIGATPPGGAYTGPGVAGSQFDPAAAGPGNHLITYTYANSLGCAQSCNFEATVWESPELACPPDQEVAAGSPPFPLEGAAPAGGTYSGAGVEDGRFDPGAAGPGGHTLTYQFTDSLGCTASCSFSMEVTAAAATLGDFVWLDENRNGLQDAGEEGLEGMAVVLEASTGAGFAPVDTAVTDEQGHYQFEAAAGTYRLQFRFEGELLPTMPDQGNDESLDSDIGPDGYTATYSLSLDEVDLTIDAGFFPACINVMQPGAIGEDQYLCGPGNVPAPIQSLMPPSGGEGEIVYLWMSSTTPGPFNLQTWDLILGADGPEYAPGPLSETTYFARCARRENCTIFLETNIVTITVGDEAEAAIEGPEVLCVGEPATFTAADAGPGASYEWEMGLGLTPAAASGPEATLSAPYSHGRFNITLAVTSNGCTATQTRQITATQHPFYCGAPLPLNASSMDIQGVSCIKLDWRLEELQPDYAYTVLHAKAGDEVYEPIARYDQPKSYLGNQCLYEHLHEGPGPGIHRYRIKVHTPEGEEMYSDQAVVALLDEVLLFPNPARHTVTVSLASPFVVGDRLELFNALGQRLQTLRVGSGQRQLDVDVSALPAGPYFFRLRRGQTQWEMLRFVKE